MGKKLASVSVGVADGVVVVSGMAMIKGWDMPAGGLTIPVAVVGCAESSRVVMKTAVPPINNTVSHLEAKNLSISHCPRHKNDMIVIVLAENRY